MKKLISYFLILLLISSFVIGCENTSQTEDKTPNSNTQNSNDGTSAEKPPANSDGILGANLSTAYAEMMRNDKYLMRYTMTSEYDGQALEFEITVGVAGDNSAVTNIGEGMNTSVISKNDSTYMIDHLQKTVLEIPADSMMSGEMDDNQIGTEELTYESSGQEDGLAYEKYTTADSILIYYFEGKKLVKIVIEVDEEPVVMNILEMSNTVPDSIFEIPADYAKTTLSD
ncbi:MAG TPA: hypothetical protein VFC74_08775 [Oscillospiraceae bacterium]|nr:hypothetical protein [Oscillospiraceae bacterium]